MISITFHSKHSLISIPLIVFSKLFSVLKISVLVDMKLISVVILVLMSTSIDCQSNQSICDFLINEGRVRDLGLYRWASNGSFSYRLFSREVDFTSGEDIPKEYEYALEIKDWNVSAQKPPILEKYGFQKFYGGCQASSVEVCNKAMIPQYNCALRQWV